MNLLSRLTQPPGWVLDGAKFDLDFANNRYWGGNVNWGTANTTVLRMQSLLSEQNSGAATSTLYAPDGNGVLQTFPAYGLRITPGKGLWVEGSYTNYALWCRDFTNAVWTLSFMTSAKTQTGADGKANAASLLTATGANATALQSITQASTAFITSCYIKRVSGSGTVSITTDGSTYTDVTSQINSNTYTLVQNAAQTLANPTVGIKLGTSGNSIAVDFFQTENNNLGATTPMLTTSTSLGRGQEEAFFNTSSTSYNDGIRWVYDVTYKRPASCVVVATGNGGSGCLLTGNDIGKFFLTGGCDGNAAGFNGISTVNTGTFGLGNINKAAARWNGAASSVCLNGGAVASNTSAFDNTTPTHGGIGNRGAGDLPLNGYCLRATYWDRELTDGEMLEFTR